MTVVDQLLPLILVSISRLTPATIDCDCFARFLNAIQNLVAAHKTCLYVAPRECTNENGSVHALLLDVSRRSFWGGDLIICSWKVGELNLPARCFERKFESQFRRRLCKYYVTL